MGLFSKLIGTPEPDPSGQSREHFDLAAKTAMKMAMRRNIPRAVQHMEVFLMKISQEFGYQHPDIGRGKLAKAAFLYMGADLYTAGIESESALQVLRLHPDICAFDIDAAIDFQNLIKSSVLAMAGIDAKPKKAKKVTRKRQDKDEPKLEDRPFGMWIKRLEM